jgi:glyoxylase-like metal-dependent hydrolase (beta-lactamase superfamily II)
VLSLPGHDPGHVGLRLGQDAVLIADAAGHPALLDQAAWCFESDHDHERSAETRRALVRELADTEALVVCGHYPRSGIGRVATRGDRVVWEEAKD